MNPKDPRDQHPNTKAEIAASKAAEEQARAPVVQQRNPDGSLVPYPDTRSASVAQNATQATQDAQGRYSDPTRNADGSLVGATDPRASRTNNPRVNDQRTPEQVLRRADGSIVGAPDSQRQVAEATAADEAAMRERRAAGTAYPTDQARTSQEATSATQNLQTGADVRSGERKWNAHDQGYQQYPGNPQHQGQYANQGMPYPDPQLRAATNQGLPPHQYSSGGVLTADEVADYRSLAASRDSSLRPTGQVFAAEPPLTQQEVASYFAYAKLPENLHNLAKEFYDVASVLVGLPASTERTVAIRKLLESRDSAVRVATPITVPPGVVPGTLSPDVFSPTNQNQPYPTYPTNQQTTANQQNQPVGQPFVSNPPVK